MTHYAIGDIQGCFSALECLLKKIQFNSDKDYLWLAGDLVNRGPQSLETLRFVKSLGSRAHVVLGNHDIHLLASYYSPQQTKNDSSLSTVLRAPDCDELMEWLRHQPLLISSDELAPGMWNYPEHAVMMVHAGIPPIWSLDQAKAYAKEAEQLLQSSDIKQHIEQIYGNKPHCWEDSLSGYDRFRAIINYLTRMRFCKENGTLEFKHKAGPDVCPPGYLPWYRHNRSSLNPFHIVFGHWSALEGQIHSNNIHALDTGCVWGKKLTALNLSDFSIQDCDCTSMHEAKTAS